MALFPGMTERFAVAVERLIQMGWALHTRWGRNPHPWHHGCSTGTYSGSAANSTSSHFVSQNSIWFHSPCCAPGLFAVRQELSCSSCLPEETAFPTLTELLTPSQMSHAIISEKFRELTSAPSFYHLSPSYSLTCFSGSKKPLIFILLVSNKTGTNGSWQNVFSVSAGNLSAWCPWNAQCD